MSDEQCNIKELDEPFRRGGREGLQFDHSVDGNSENEREREATLPFWAQSVLRHLRSNVTGLQRNIEPKNREIRALRSQLRLLNRVMRLKNEALVDDYRPAPVMLRKGGENTYETRETVTETQRSRCGCYGCSVGGRCIPDASTPSDYTRTVSAPETPFGSAKVGRGLPDL